MKVMKIAAFSAALLASGCASEMAWQRVDGRPVDQGFRYAAAECRGRAEHHEEAAVEAMKRCMYRRGYVWTAVYTGNGYENGYNGNGTGYKSYGHRGNRYDNDD
jgi:hypothetical protein